jgi:hypothetical protein
MLNVLKPNVFMLMVANNAFMQSVIMQSVVMLHVFMLSVMTPRKYFKMLKKLRVYVSAIQSFKVLFKLDYPSLLPF